MKIFTRRTQMALIAALGLTLGLTASAPAQFGEAAGFGEMMSPYFLRRDLHLIAEALELDEGQVAIVETLYWDYEDEHNESRARMLERLTEMREEIDNLERDEILARVFQPFEDRADEWSTMRENLLSDVRTILNSQQLEQWEPFRRRLRREKELPKGRFSGESLDLFLVVRDADMSPPEREIARSVLADYELYIDQLIMKRERLMHESRLAMMHSIRDDDPDRALGIYDAQIDARVRIRQANDDYIDLLGAELNEATGAAFRSLALERGYPRIFRPTAAQNLFAEAVELEDITEDVRAQIQTLAVTFDAELAMVNATIITLLREYEPQDARYRARSFAQRALDKKPERPTDPTREHFHKRDELGHKYVTLLKSLLTDEQFASLKGARRFMRRQRAAGEPGMDSAQPPNEGRAAQKRRLNDEREQRRRSLGGGGNE